MTRLKLGSAEAHEKTKSRLRREIAASLVVRDDAELSAKDAVRARHSLQREAALHDVQPFLDEYESAMLEQFALGDDVDPTRIRPQLVPVATDAEARLFKYAALHWSVPVSGGYGRRTRFLVRDEQNGKLIGIFALSDPVYNLSARDELIGWDDRLKRTQLYRVFDASIIGAVRPYSDLLGGKLIALSSIARQTLDFIEQKYKGSRTVISGRSLEHTRPLLVTTTSALGRSSLYNRLRIGGRSYFQEIGWTKGYGHFQLPDDLFARLVELLEDSGYVKARSNAYGYGPNWKLRTIRAGLEYLELDPNLTRHGIARQIFIAPTAANWSECLRDVALTPKYFDDDLEEMGALYCRRWAIGRSFRRPEYKEFVPDLMRLSRSGAMQLTLPAWARSAMSG